MKHELRYYQQEAVDATWSYWGNGGGNPVVALPTGTGKSLVIAEMCERFVRGYRGGRVAVVTHREELVEQNYAEILGQWSMAPCGIYCAGLGRRDLGMPVTFATVGSVYQRGRHEFAGTDLVIVDEAHLVSPRGGTMYERFLRDLKLEKPWLRVVALTATPYRLGQGHITNGDTFDEVVCDYTTRERYNRLEDDGYLAPLVVRKTDSALDVSDVLVRGGEFVQKQLQHSVDKHEVTEAAVDEMVRLGPDRNRWLVFTTGIDHAEHTGASLARRLGTSAVGVVHSKQTKEHNRRVLKLFKRGNVRAVVNADKLTTGFNVPGIDLLAVLRPVMSPGLWVQMLGRGTRPAGGKTDCLVLDFARNAERLGPINDPVLPSPPGAKKGDGRAPVKLCEECGNYAHPTAKVCKVCGVEFPPPPTRLVPESGTVEVVAKGARKKEPPAETTHEVTGVEYTKHVSRKNNLASMLVKYRCGLRVFKEWVCVEHDGYPGLRAQEWWRGRHPKGDHATVPNTVADALLFSGELLEPVSVTVRETKPYPTILDVEVVPF